MNPSTGIVHAGATDDLPPQRRDAADIEIAIVPRDASPAVYDGLTSMLHRAYRGQVEMGLRPLAGRQPPEVTRRRCQTGETFVALRRAAPASPAAADTSPAEAIVAEPTPVGMILFEEQEEAAFPAWFLRPEVAHFSLFAVDSDVQGLGIGARLLAAVDDRAASLGFRELALSMAEPDTGLLSYYRRRGFRFVQHWRWPYTNYRSAILSRWIGGGR